MIVYSNFSLSCLLNYVVITIISTVDSTQKHINGRLKCFEHAACFIALLVHKYELKSGIWPDDRGVFTVTAIAMISAPASDDEGSTAATDGSTLRTSPAEHGGSVGSESGGSAIDSVAGEHSGGWFQKKKNSDREHNQMQSIMFVMPHDFQNVKYVDGFSHSLMGFKLYTVILSIEQFSYKTSEYSIY